MPAAVPVVRRGDIGHKTGCYVYVGAQRSARVLAIITTLNKGVRQASMMQEKGK